MKRMLAPLDSYAQRALKARLHREPFETRPIEAEELTPALTDYVHNNRASRQPTAEATIASGIDY